MFSVLVYDLSAFRKGQKYSLLSHSGQIQASHQQVKVSGSMQIKSKIKNLSVR